MGNRGTAPRIHKLGRRRIVSFTPRPTYSLGKSPRYALDRRLCDPGAGVDPVEKRKEISPLLGAFYSSVGQSLQ
jgi:hypothetical protein